MEPDVVAGCRRVAEVLVRAELVHMATGLPPGGDPAGAVRREFAGTAALDRAERVNDALLVTAAGDLLGPYRRDVDALVRSYLPRIAAACAVG